MRETLGSQGVQTLLGKLKDQEKKTEDAEKKGEQAENKGTLDSYDSAITDAAQKSEEAKKEQEQQKKQGDFSDAGNGGNGDDFTGGVDESVENPIPIIRRVRKMGLLDLVVPSERGISDAVTDRKSLTSGRKLQTGLMLDTDIRSDNSYTSGILFGQYLLKKLGNYRRPAAAGLNYQVEYILGGKNSDRENLKSVAGKLLVIRQGVNMAYLLSDGGKRIQGRNTGAGDCIRFSDPTGGSSDRSGTDLLLGICGEYSGCPGTFCRRTCTSYKKLLRLAAVFA